MGLTARLGPFAPVPLGVLADERVSDLGALTLGVLAYELRGNLEGEVRVRRIADRLGRHRRTIEHVLEQLEELGLIAVERRGGRPSLYRLGAIVAEQEQLEGVENLRRSSAVGSGSDLRRSSAVGGAVPTYGAGAVPTYGAATPISYGAATPYLRRTSREEQKDAAREDREPVEPDMSRPPADELAPIIDDVMADLEGFAGAVARESWSDRKRRRARPEPVQP